MLLKALATEAMVPRGRLMSRCCQDIDKKRREMSDYGAATRHGILLPTPIRYRPYV